MLYLSKRERNKNGNNILGGDKAQGVLGRGSPLQISCFSRGYLSFYTARYNSAIHVPLNLHIDRTIKSDSGWKHRITET